MVDGIWLTYRTQVLLAAVLLSFVLKNIFFFKDRLLVFCVGMFHHEHSWCPRRCGAAALLLGIKPGSWARPSAPNH